MEWTREREKCEALVEPVASPTDAARTAKEKERWQAREAGKGKARQGGRTFPLLRIFVAFVVFIDQGCYHQRCLDFEKGSERSARVKIYHNRRAPVGLVGSDRSSRRCAPRAKDTQPQEEALGKFLDAFEEHRKKEKVKHLEDLRAEGDQPDIDQRIPCREGRMHGKCGRDREGNVEETAGEIECDDPRSASTCRDICRRYANSSRTPEREISAACQESFFRAGGFRLIVDSTDRQSKGTGCSQASTGGAGGCSIQKCQQEPKERYIQFSREVRLGARSCGQAESYCSYHLFSGKQCRLKRDIKGIEQCFTSGRIEHEYESSNTVHVGAMAFKATMSVSWNGNGCSVLEGTHVICLLPTFVTEYSFAQHRGFHLCLS